LLTTSHSEFYEENRFQKFTRRLKEEPLIPLGMALTTWALLSAARSVRSGDSAKTNRMFRARIYAQGFTVAAMFAGSMYWKSDRQKRKEYDSVVAEKKAQEKNLLWIKELEARDAEDKELRAARDARRKAAAGGRRDDAGTAAEKIGGAQKSVLESVAGDKDEKKSKGVLESLGGLVGMGKKEATDAKEEVKREVASATKNLEDTRESVAESLAEGKEEVKQKGMLGSLGWGKK